MNFLVVFLPFLLFSDSSFCMDMQQLRSDYEKSHNKLLSLSKISESKINPSPINTERLVQVLVEQVINCNSPTERLKCIENIVSLNETTIKELSYESSTYTAFLVMVKLLKLGIDFPGRSVLETTVSCSINRLNSSVNYNESNLAPPFVLVIKYLLNSEILQKNDNDLGEFISVFVPLFNAINVKNTEQDDCVSLIEFCNVYKQNFGKNLLDELERGFPFLVGEKNLVKLRTLFFLEFIVEQFPLSSFDKSDLLSVMLGRNQISTFTSSPFSLENKYGSQEIFDLFSSRIIYVLGSLFKKELELGDLYKILIYLGHIRTIISLFSQSNTQFGELADYTLVEPWGNYHNLLRVCCLMIFPGLPFREAANKSLENVEHIPPFLTTTENQEKVFFKNWDFFLQPLQASLLISNETNWKKSLSEFVYWFSVSSTFKRGQSAIMEWIVKSVMLSKEMEFKLKYHSLEEVDKSFPFIFRQLNSDSIVEISNFEELLKYIANRISKDYHKICEVDVNLLRNILQKYFSHLDVIALEVSLASSEHVKKFLSFFMESINWE